MLPGTRVALFIVVLFGVTFHESVLAHVHHHESGVVSEQPDSLVDRLISAAIDAQSQHDFSTALELAHEALAIRKDNDQAWLLLASIQLVRGRPDAAAAACRRLRAASPLVILTCHARVALARDDISTIKPKLESLLLVMEPSWVSRETLAWSLSVAGDLAVAAGETNSAVRHFTKSLEILDNLQVRAALVDVLIGNDRLDAAANVIDAVAGSLALAIRRLIIAKERGFGAEDEAEARALDRKFRAWIAEENWLHAREMARFYLDVVDDPKLARELALTNVKLQREPEDIRLYLAALCESRGTCQAMSTSFEPVRTTGWSERHTNISKAW